jgi:hypothetical protein
MKRNNVDSATDFIRSGGTERQTKIAAIATLSIFMDIDEEARRNAIKTTLNHALASKNLGALVDSWEMLEDDPTAEPTIGDDGAVAHGLSTTGYFFDLALFDSPRGAAAIAKAARRLMPIAHIAKMRLTIAYPNGATEALPLLRPQ